MNFGERNHVAQIGIGNRIHVQVGGKWSATDACSPSLDEILTRGIDPIGRRAGGKRVFEAVKVAPSFAHRAPLEGGVALADQAHADAVSVLMNDDLGIESAVGEDAYGPVRTSDR